jgi:hypothetical protein
VEDLTPNHVLVTRAYLSGIRSPRTRVSFGRRWGDFLPLLRRFRLIPSAAGIPSGLDGRPAASRSTPRRRGRPLVAPRFRLFRNCRSRSSSRNTPGRDATAFKQQLCQPKRRLYRGSQAQRSTSGNVQSKEALTHALARPMPVRRLPGFTPACRKVLTDHDGDQLDEPHPVSR